MQTNVFVSLGFYRTMSHNYLMHCINDIKLEGCLLCTVK